MFTLNRQLQQKGESCLLMPFCILLPNDLTAYSLMMIETEVAIPL